MIIDVRIQINCVIPKTCLGQGLILRNVLYYDLRMREFSTYNFDFIKMTFLYYVRLTQFVK